MSDHALSRRRFLGVSAGAALAFPLTHSLAPASSQTQVVRGKQSAIAIASENGLKAVELAYEQMVHGADPLDAAIAGVGLLEDDPDDHTVGYGGIPNEDGVVELDAAVMHGPTARGGAVASLQGIRHPAQVAKCVMEQTDHVLLVGEGALRFARAHGFKEEELLTEKSRMIWLYWKQTHSVNDDWLPPPAEQVDPEIRAFVGRSMGTIHLGAMNERGDLSCTTTTSGLFYKIAGRVGDSPIPGAGLYVDNEVGSCGSTGRGEANLLNLSSFLGVELMRNGMSPVDAGMEVLRRVASRTKQAHLLDSEGRPRFGLRFYLLNKKGEYAGVSMWGPGGFAVADAKGARIEECACLFDRG